MNIKETTYKNKKKLIIYITKIEHSDPKIIEQIDNFKKVYDGISVFISGNKDIREYLTQIINDKVKESSVCV